MTAHIVTAHEADTAAGFPTNVRPAGPCRDETLRNADKATEVTFAERLLASANSGLGLFVPG